MARAGPTVGSVSTGTRRDPERIMKRISTTVLGLGIAGVLLLPLTPEATASSGHHPAPAAASVARMRTFTATGTMGRYYTKQTVTGVYKSSAGRPLDVTLYDWQGTAVLVKHRPA